MVINHHVGLSSYPLGPLQTDSTERCTDRSIPVDGIVGDHAHQNYADSDIQHCADHQAADDADGQVALGILALLGAGGDGVESNVREENDTSSGQHSCSSDDTMQ